MVLVPIEVTLLLALSAYFRPTFQLSADKPPCPGHGAISDLSDEFPSSSPSFHLPLTLSTSYTITTTIRPSVTAPADLKVKRAPAPDDDDHSSESTTSSSRRSSSLTTPSSSPAPAASPSSAAAVSPSASTPGAAVTRPASSGAPALASSTPAGQPAATSAAAAPSHHVLTNSDKIAMGVSIPVGLFTIVGTVATIWMFFRQKKSEPSIKSETASEKRQNSNLSDQSTGSQKKQENQSDLPLAVP